MTLGSPGAPSHQGDKFKCVLVEPESSTGTALTPCRGVGEPLAQEQASTPRAFPSCRQGDRLLCKVFRLSKLTHSACFVCVFLNSTGHHGLHCSKGQVIPFTLPSPGPFHSWHRKSSSRMDVPTAQWWWQCQCENKSASRGHSWLSRPHMASHGGHPGLPFIAPIYRFNASAMATHLRHLSRKT